MPWHAPTWELNALMAAIEVESLDELVTSIESVRASKRVRLIGMDGEDGVGKTTLATELGPRLNAKTVHMDCFLEKDKGGYTNHVDVTCLATALDGALAWPGPILVEGVCLLAVLKRIHRRPDALIYVRQIAWHGHWYNKAFLDPDPDDGDPEERARKENAPSLRTEVIKYHRTFRPISLADIVFNRRKPRGLAI